jgi:cell division septal protein FtsQ
MSIKDFKKNIDLKPKTSFFGFRKKNKNTKDFSWQGGNVNPFKKEDKRTKRIIYLYLFLILFCILITLSVLIFHPFFKINKIEIKGLQRIERMEIETVVNDLLDLNSFIFLPSDSFFIINLENTEEILKNRFPIENIKIEKYFPNEIKIEIEEKITTIIYDNGKEYSFINLKGDVVEIFRKVSSYEWQEITQTTTSTDENGEILEEKLVIDKIHEPDVKNLIKDVGNYPIIFDKIFDEAQLNKNVLDEKYANKIIEWFNLLNKSDNKIKYFLIDESPNQMFIITYNGWYIKTNVDREVNTQIKEIETILKQEIKDNFFYYIDLRYPDRIYWK